MADARRCAHNRRTGHAAPGSPVDMRVRLCRPLVRRHQQFRQLSASVRSVHVHVIHGFLFVGFVQFLWPKVLLVRSEHRRVRSGEDFDIIIGLLGFWTLVLLVVTVWMEVTARRPSAGRLACWLPCWRCTG